MKVPTASATIPARLDLASERPAFTKQVLLYGLPKGETERYTEALLAGNCETEADIERVKAAASADGWHSFRLATYDGSPPDFGAVL